MQPEHRPLGGKMILYRPVGSKELELIKKSNYRRFPPRLTEQPIFYPVLNWMNLMSISSEKYISSVNFQIDNLLSCKTGVTSEAIRGLSGIGSLTRREVQRIIGIQSE